MLKRAIIVLAVFGLMCSAALPFWALAACPTMNAGSGAHSCCHRQPAPSTTPPAACIQHCSSSVGVLVKVQAPPQPGPAAAAPAEVASLHSPVAAFSVPAATGPFFDSSGPHRSRQG